MGPADAEVRGSQTSRLHRTLTVRGLRLAINAG